MAAKKSSFLSSALSGPLGFFSSASRPLAQRTASRVTPVVNRAVSSIRSSPTASRALSTIGRASSLTPFSIGRSAATAKPVQSALNRFSSTASNIARGIGSTMSKQYTKQPITFTRKSPVSSFGSQLKGASNAFSGIGRALSGGLGSIRPNFAGFSPTIGRVNSSAGREVLDRSGNPTGAEFDMRKVTNPISSFGQFITPIKQAFSNRIGSDFSGSLLSRGGLSGKTGGKLTQGGLNQGFNLDANNAEPIPGTNKLGVLRSAPALPMFKNPTQKSMESLVNIPGTSMYFDASMVGKGAPMQDMAWQKDPVTGQFKPVQAHGFNNNPQAQALLARAIADWQVTGRNAPGTHGAGYGYPLSPTLGSGPVDYGLPQDQSSGGIWDKFKSAFSDPQKMAESFDKYKNMYEQGKGMFEQLKASFDSGGDEGEGGAPAGAGELAGIESGLSGQGGVGPLDPAITRELLELLGGEFQPMSEDEIAAIMRDIEKSEQDELDFIIDQYKNLRPGADIESDSSFRRDLGEVREKYAKLKQDALAKGRRDVRGEFNDTMLKTLGVATGQSQFTNESLANALSARLNLQNTGRTSLLNQFSQVFPSTIAFL